MGIISTENKGKKVIVLSDTLFNMKYYFWKWKHSVYTHGISCSNGSVYAFLEWLASLMDSALQT